MLPPSLTKNDKLARLLIISVSLIIFIAVVVLSRVSVDVSLPFDKHIFATINAIINSMVSLLLIWGLITAKQKKYVLHKKVMMGAILLSVVFLLSYIAHHLFAGETKFGGTGAIKLVYYVVLFSHIVLAGVILPFILFTAYRALIGEYERHKKIARYTWPLWLYVSISGVLVYLFISPYYQ